MSAKKTPRTPAPAIPDARPPAEARVHPPLQLWLSNPDNANWLRAVFTDSRWVAACHYVKDALQVTPKDLLGPNAELSQVIVRKAALHAGATHAIRLLESLPNRLKADAPPQEEAWGYLSEDIQP